jgi:hypothetical protein
VEGGRVTTLVRHADRDPVTGSNSSDGLGLLAAWVGDECLLGRSSQAWATVDQLQSQGKLTGAAGGNWPTGAAYVSKLHQFLAGHGYCP